ncbi:hypothetical protein LTR62_003715 [Meristemomyces frigidus]|uniref:Uncharacterized protein n=1 Tax=Meristemomyces frigidus TaxID=1508187 RepID=A0AAN7YKB8_9PEZI|nr:hypothetical protein LTR62_003715 [Meristemomyces frigidus]
MYRTSDPRFRRRLHELGATVESATEQAQSGLYIFGHTYLRPAVDSVASCLTTCVDASCPTLNLAQRDRLRRQRGRGRSRGRAELNFDFYDDWDDLEETDGLLGWSDGDEGGAVGVGGLGYGAIAAQPPRQKGMSYAKGRRKSGAGVEGDATVVPGGSAGFFGRMFGGRALKYRPSAADLQEHPGARRNRRKMTEGEALLEEEEGSANTGRVRKHGRKRSGTAGTAGSATTTDSYSSRGDIFPSDDEDAIPLDDEFAMVLERRTTNPHSGTETESSSNRTSSQRRGKRPSAGSRTSTGRRTLSTRSTRSSAGGRQSRSHTNSNLASPIAERRQPEMLEEADFQSSPPASNDLRTEEQRTEAEEEAATERKHHEAQRVAEQKGLPEPAATSTESAEEPVMNDTLETTFGITATPASATEEPSQLPTPLPTDDEEDDNHHPIQQGGSTGTDGSATQPPRTSEQGDR